MVLFGQWMAHHSIRQMSLADTMRSRSLQPLSPFRQILANPTPDTGDNEETDLADDVDADRADEGNNQANETSVLNLHLSDASDMDTTDGPTPGLPGGSPQLGQPGPSGLQGTRFGAQTIGRRHNWPASYFHQVQTGTFFSHHKLENFSRVTHIPKS